MQLFFFLKNYQYWKKIRPKIDFNLPIIKKPSVKMLNGFILLILSELKVLKFDTFKFAAPKL